MKNTRFFLTIMILLAAAGINYYFSHPDISLPRKNLTDFPKQLGDWTSVSDHKIEGRSMEILQVDDYLMRTYRNSKGEVIGLYIGYFQSQKEGKGIHSPRLCLPGAGWVPVNISTHPLSVPNRNPETVPVNKFTMGKGLDRQLYLFWYHGRNRAYASEYWNKLYLIWDGLTKRRTDGALIRVNNTVMGDPDKALKIQTEFIHLFYPLLKEYIPD
jgi:EpsI family protein